MLPFPESLASISHTFELEETTAHPLPTQIALNFTFLLEKKHLKIGDWKKAAGTLKMPSQGLVAPLCMGEPSPEDTCLSELLLFLIHMKSC